MMIMLGLTGRCQSRFSQAIKRFKAGELPPDQTHASKRIAGRPIISCLLTMFKLKLVVNRSMLHACMYGHCHRGEHACSRSKPGHAQPTVTCQFCCCCTSVRQQLSPLRHVYAMLSQPENETSGTHVKSGRLSTTTSTTPGMARVQRTAELHSDPKHLKTKWSSQRNLDFCSVLFCQEGSCQPPTMAHAHVVVLLVAVATVRATVPSNAPYAAPGPSSYELMDYNPVADVSGILFVIVDICSQFPAQWPHHDFTNRITDPFGVQRE